jgi:hypothetical protein
LERVLSRAAAICRRSACAIAALFASPALGAEEDGNIWLGQFVTVDIASKAFVRLEAQERFTQDGARLGQLLLRSAAGYRITPRLSVAGGYAFVRTDPVGPARLNEHRFYQEVNLRLIDRAGLRLDTRTRLEQRLFAERSGTAWRLRHCVQARVPISGRKAVVVYSEPFIELDDAPVQRGGLAIWRNFAGVALPLAPGIEAVPGYLNQYVVRDGADRIDHAATLNLFATF